VEKGREIKINLTMKSLSNPSLQNSHEISFLKDFKTPFIDYTLGKDKQNNTISFPTDSSLSTKI
jgi:hypothetical protein